MQHFCSHLRTKEMLDDVLKTMFDGGNQTSFNVIDIQHHVTSCNMVAKRVQHGHWIQQCWIMLHQHVGSVWPDL